MLKIGETAPAFALLDQNGETRALNDFAGRQVLVYFYPRASTPGCTTQACALRDAACELGDTAVLGVRSLSA